VCNRDSSTETERKRDIHLVKLKRGIIVDVDVWTDTLFTYSKVLPGRMHSYSPNSIALHTLQKNMLTTHTCSFPLWTTKNPVHFPGIINFLCRLEGEKKTADIGSVKCKLVSTKALMLNASRCSLFSCNERSVSRIHQDIEVKWVWWQEDRRHGERERAEEMYRLKCLAVGFKVQEMDNVTTCMDQYIGCNVRYIVSPASLQHNTFHHYSCQHHHHHSSSLTGCQYLLQQKTKLLNFRIS
jgi:hypothetical protein